MTAERWRDAHGVVHAVGMVPTTTLITPITSEWRTLCLIIPIVNVMGSDIETTAHYTTEPTTCLRCVVKEK